MMLLSDFIDARRQKRIAAAEAAGVNTTCTWFAIMQYAKGIGSVRYSNPQPRYGHYPTSLQIFGTIPVSTPMHEGIAEGIFSQKVKLFSKYTVEIAEWQRRRKEAEERGEDGYSQNPEHHHNLTGRDTEHNLIIPQPNRSKENSYQDLNSEA